MDIFSLFESIMIQRRLIEFKENFD